MNGNRWIALACAAAAACSGGGGGGEGRVPSTPAPVIQLSASTATFSMTAGAGDPDGQTISLACTGAAAVPSASVSYGSHQGWLVVNVVGSATPFSLALEVVGSGLAPGAYTAVVSVTAPGANVQQVGVTLHVHAAEAPSLAVAPGELAFAAAVAGEDPASRDVTVTNAGSGSLATPVVAVEPAAAAGWVAATVMPANGAFTVRVQPTSAGLAMGEYTATLRISSAGAENSPVSVAVRLVVSAAPVPARLAVSPASLDFAFKRGQGQSGTIFVTNAGTAPLATPTVTVSYLDGAGWLHVTLSGSGNGYLATVTPDANVPAGTYRANVLISSPGALDSPRTVPVQVRVSRSVTVTRVHTLWKEDGTLSPWTPSDVAAVGLTPLESAAGELPPTSTPGPGRWYFDDVPGGDYSVRVLRTNGVVTFYVANGEELDLGSDYGGRKPTATCPHQPTPVSFTFGGLSPWSGDSMQLYSFDGIVWDYFPPFGVADGATSGSGSYDWYRDPYRRSGFCQPLLEPGDLLWAAQARLSTVGPFADGVETMVSWSSTTGIALTEGAPSALPLSFAPVTPASLTIDWRTTEFAALLPGVSSHSLTVSAMPMTLGGSVPLFGTTSMDLLSVTTSPVVGDRALGPVAFGRFLPPRYKEFVAATTTAPSVTVELGGSSPTHFWDYVERYDAIPAPSPIRPLVGPPTALTIGGLPASAQQTGVGMMPRLAWRPPDVGSASLYIVTIYQVWPQDGLTSKQAIATIVTPHTEVALPSGVVTFGGTYVAVVRAHHGMHAAAPSRATLPYGAATVTSQPFRP